MKTLLTNPLGFLTKEKEVPALIVGFNFETNELIAQLKNQRAIIAQDDISIYQTNNKEELHKLIGSMVYCKKIGINKQHDILLSRKAVMEKRIKELKKGDTVEATIVSASDRALFLEFDEGLSGIMYKNQITSSKLYHPLDIYNVGDKIRCKIIKKNEDNGFFELSRLALYKSEKATIKAGSTMLCKLTKKLEDNSGYFAEVFTNPQYSGILDLNKFNINQKYETGEILKLKVVNVKNNKQLKLRSLTCSK